MKVSKVLAAALILAVCSLVGIGKALADGTLANPAYSVIQNPSGQTLTLPLQPYASDAIPNGSAYGLFTTSFVAGFNGSTSDRLRVDPGASGVLRTAAGGSVTAAIAAATAGPTVVKNVPGRIARVLITTAGTASETFYDNASACSGTIIGITPATTSVGTVIDFSFPAANGITGCGGAGSPAVTVSYN